MRNVSRGRCLVPCLLLLCAAMPLRARASAPSPLTLTALRTEYRVDPVGIDARQPRLSWQLLSDRRGAVQTAYRIQVAADAGALQAERDLLWDTDKVASDASIHRTYEGPPLASRRRYYWRVRVWDGDGRASDWSAPAFWEMGLLDAADWQAAWIEPAWDEDPAASQPAPMLRTTFELDGRVASARAYVTSLGLYELALNGRRVGDELFTPGWTSYGDRLQYQTYDVTGLLESGENAAGVLLGDGWYRGNLAWGGQRNTYGERLALLLQIEVTYEDGRTQRVTSGDGWKATTGPIRLSDIYDGEVYDARLEKTGWSRPGYDDGDWQGVRVADHPKTHLIAPAGPPVRRIEEIRPVAQFRTPEGDLVFDMGQNMVGWIRLKVQGPAGTEVTLRHVEVLDRDGNVYTANLRAADQKVTYILKGEGEEVYEPHFTFQGFRYVAVDGYPGEPALDALTGVVIHSDMAPTGRFESSNPLLNQLQHNIVWGQKGNFLDVPTDCPQRDERLGWTGDAQVFARTAAFNYDVAGFFTKWLGDLAADQYENGSIPFVIPDALTKPDQPAAGSAAWADAGVIIPWTMYLVYGDARLLERQYPSMTAWVGYMQERAGDDLIWDGDFHFGDWLAYATTDPSYPGATTGKELIATAFFAHSAGLVAQAARVLGKTDEADRYAALQDRVKAAFQREFVTASGRVGENTQTAYVLALQFDLLPEALRAEAARRLAENVRRHGHHLTTGFVGTPYLCHVLSRHGHLDVAYALLNQETYPSWLYPVRMGATTIWERWDGIKPDSTFQDPGMNSFNHYAYGAIGEWLYHVVAGIELDPAAPAYKHVRIQPQPGGGLTHVDAALTTMYGDVGSAWRLEDGRFTLNVTVPPNTRATVRLPGAVLAQVAESGSALDAAGGIAQARQDDGAVVVEVGSGTYAFAYPVE